MVAEKRGISLQNTVFWLYSGDSGHESRMLSSEARFPCCNPPARVLRKPAASCSKRWISVRMLPRGLQMHRTLNPQPLQFAALKPKPSTIVSTGVANDPRFSNAFETSICKAPLDRGVWGVDNPQPLKVRLWVVGVGIRNRKCQRPGLEPPHDFIEGG